MRNEENLTGGPDSASLIAGGEIPVVPPDGTAEVVAFGDPEPPGSGGDEPPPPPEGDAPGDPEGPGSGGSAPAGDPEPPGSGG